MHHDDENNDWQLLLYAETYTTTMTPMMINNRYFRVRGRIKSPSRWHRYKYLSTLIRSTLMCKRKETHFKNQQKPHPCYNKLEIPHDSSWSLQFGKTKGQHMCVCLSVAVCCCLAGCVWVLLMCLEFGLSRLVNWTAAQKLSCGISNLL